MKAKLFEAKNAIEVRLENGVQFFANEGEDSGDLVERVTETVERDYVESVEFDVVDPKKLKKQGTTQLAKKLEKAKDVEAKMIEEILEDRGAKVEKKEETPATDSTEESTEESTEDSGDETPAEEKPKKEPKPKKEKPSMEVVLEDVSVCKGNIGKCCQFIPFREDNAVLGVVKQVVIDRRVNKAYYRIIGEGENGKLYHTEINNDTFIIDEEASAKRAAELKAEEDRIAAEKQAAKEKKEAAKKAKAEAKKKADAEKAETEKAEESTEETAE